MLGFRRLRFPALFSVVFSEVFSKVGFQTVFRPVPEKTWFSDPPQKNTYPFVFSSMLLFVPLPNTHLSLKVDPGQPPNPIYF